MTSGVSTATSDATSTGVASGISTALSTAEVSNVISVCAKSLVISSAYATFGASGFGIKS